MNDKSEPKGANPPIQGTGSTNTQDTKAIDNQPSTSIVTAGTVQKKPIKPAIDPNATPNAEIETPTGRKRPYKRRGPLDLLHDSLTVEVAEGSKRDRIKRERYK